eukprot:5143551-Ditylum_brightwellii.AAC.1
MQPNESIDEFGNFKSVQLRHDNKDLNWKEKGLDFAVSEAKAIQDNLMASRGWVSSTGSAQQASTSNTRSNDSAPKETPSCPTYLKKPCLCNDNVERLLKAYCCPLHRADGHSLLQYDVLLCYFNISLKEGVDLPKPLKTQPSARPVTSPQNLAPLQAYLQTPVAPWPSQPVPSMQLT